VRCEHSREAVKNHVRNLAFPRPLRPWTITLRSAGGHLLEVLEPHTSKQRHLQPVSDFAPAHRLALRCLGGMKNLNVRLEPCVDETSPDSHLKVGLRQPCGLRYSLARLRRGTNSDITSSSFLVSLRLRTEAGADYRGPARRIIVADSSCVVGRSAWRR
jgi:hypothetical protein